MTHEGPANANVDAKTVAGFGKEWSAFDQSSLMGVEYDHVFQGYFSIFPFEMLPPSAEGFDLGCGSGRWAAGVARRVGKLHCIDPSEEALAVAKRRLADYSNVEFHLAAANCMPLEQSSQDFGYSLGVLHHIPDSASAMTSCVGKLKPGAPFLLYLYYKLDNRPVWYRALWQLTDILRRNISRLPFPLRKGLSTCLAGSVYWPLARVARLAEGRGFDISHFPLGFYRNSSFYTMRTDALDRFGTRLEQRFSRSEIEEMMIASGLTNIRFKEEAPYWTACGFRQSDVQSG